MYVYVCVCVYVCMCVCVCVHACVRVVVCVWGGGCSCTHTRVRVYTQMEMNFKCVRKKFHIHSFRVMPVHLISLMQTARQWDRKRVRCFSASVRLSSSCCLWMPFPFQCHRTQVCFLLLCSEIQYSHVAPSGLRSPYLAICSAHAFDRRNKVHVYISPDDILWQCMQPNSNDRDEDKKSQNWNKI